MYVALVDGSEQVVTASNDDQLVLRMTSTESAYSPLYNIQTPLRSSLGVFNLSDVVFIGEPGSNVTLTITSPYIDESLELTEADYSLNATLSFRKCIEGEKFTSDGECVWCIEGFYLLEAPTSPRSCLKCPSNADCFGGNLIAPQPGYWRSSNTSL